MLEIKDGLKERILETIKPTLKDYCPVCKEVVLEEPCPKCKTQFLDKYLPETGEHGIGTDWAIASFVKKHGTEIDPASNDDIDAFIDFYNDNHEGVEVFGNYHNAYDLAERFSPEDLKRSQIAFFVERFKDDDTMVLVDEKWWALGDGVFRELTADWDVDMEEEPDNDPF